MGKYILTSELLASSVIVGSDETLADYLKNKYAAKVGSGGEVENGYYPEYMGAFIEVFAEGFNSEISVEVFKERGIIAASIYDSNYIFNLSKI